MKKISRRHFLQITGMAAGATMLPLPVKWLGRREAYAFYQSPQVPLFGTTLRGVGPSGIPVAVPDGTAAPVTGVTHYTIDIAKFKDAGICPGLGPTTLWGFSPLNALGIPGNGPQTPAHLGGIIVAQRGQPIQITFRNKLNYTKPIIPADKSSFFFDAATSINRTAVHLHGGYIPWISDGGPFDWFGPAGTHGPSFLNNQVLNPGAGPGMAEYYYGNDQSARMLWYHDHAHDITRTNAYSGIASAYLIRDAFEAHLRNLGLPDFIENGGNELPLIFQDKTFVGTNIGLIDPTWSSLVDPDATKPGSLWYPHLYERTRWRRTYSSLPLPNASCIPEAFQDTMLVNGTVYPEATVEGRRYRFRILNACNARFMNLQLYVDDGSANGITLDAMGNPTNTPFVDGGLNSAAVLQIGTEGGFLPQAVSVPTNMPFNPVTLTGSLVMGPAERADILIDFKNYVGQNIILYSDAPAPFPGGDPRNDYFPGWNVAGNPVNGTTQNGFGPNTRILMRFKVIAPSLAKPADQPLTITPGFDFVAEASANSLVWNDPLIVPVGVTTPPPGVFVRPLTLNETFDPWGRLIQMLGTTTYPGNPADGFGRKLIDAPTEVVSNGTTEVWEIYNTPGDVHPMHFHLVNLQIINRQPFDVNTFNGTPNFLGPPVPPDPNETGWKETIRHYPGTVTRVIMKFNLPKITGPTGNPIDLTSVGGGLGTPPPSPRTGGHEYVWHCHILEHEEHDMMRPVVVN